MGEIAGANVFAEGHKQAVDLDPIAAREDLAERDHGLFWCGCPHVSPAIGHAVDMNIHADERLSTGNAQNEMSAFWTHPRK